MIDKPTIPEVLDRFKRYHEENLTWGSLHIVLDEHNIEDDCIQYCIDRASSESDTEGEELGRILLRMSKTQRLKLGMIA